MPPMATRGWWQASRRIEALLDVVGALAGAELDDADVGEAARAERILAHDRVDLLAARADRENDAAVARDLAARDEEMSGGIVLLQELHVRRHVRVDLRQRHLVDQLDDEHRASLPRN